MSNLYRGPPIDASYKVSVHLAKRFQKKRILKISQSETRVDCGGILYREPSKDAPYQVSIHLAKRFQRRRFFRNQPIRNKNGLWQLCLLTDRDEMSNLYRGPAIDASYQVSVHLAKRFQRRRFFFKSANQIQKQELPMTAMFVDRSG